MYVLWPGHHGKSSISVNMGVAHELRSVCCRRPVSTTIEYAVYGYKCIFQLRRYGQDIIKVMYPFKYH